MRFKMFEFDFSDKLRFKLKKLAKRDRSQLEAIKKKIRQIITLEPGEIEKRFKTLKYGMFGCKRVHVYNSFVLTFEVHKKDNLILFLDYDHHDRVYKR